MTASHHIIVPSRVEYTKWAINPYNGCDHNCLYCYGPLICKISRKNWSHSELKDWYRNPARTYEEIQRQVENELEYLPPDEPIMVSTSCDPFQRLEAKYGVMTPILRGLQEAKNNPVLICTKSDTVLNYTPLLIKIPRLEVGLTISCLDDLVRAWWEENTPSYFLRLNTLKELISLGIPTWISCEPIFPKASPIPLIHRAKDMGVRRMVFGKLNYHGNKDNPWYTQIREEIVNTCQLLNMPYMVKKELREL